MHWWEKKYFNKKKRIYPWFLIIHPNGNKEAQKIQNDRIELSFLFFLRKKRSIHSFQPPPDLSCCQKWFRRMRIQQEWGKRMFQRLRSPYHRTLLSSPVSYTLLSCFTSMTMKGSFPHLPCWGPRGSPQTGMFTSRVMPPLKQFSSKGHHARGTEEQPYCFV